MTRTPDEIKKGLECKKRVFTDSCYDRCATCELFIPCYGTVERCADALALIQKLESGLLTQAGVIATMRERIHQLEAERDAAVAGLKSNCACPECKYFSDDIQEPCRGCKPTDSKFEWRGVQKD